MVPAQYRTPPQAPPLFTATTASLVADAKKLCANSKSVMDNIVASVKPEDAAFQNVVLPMAVDENEGSLEARIIGFYQAVSTDKGLRDASTEAEKIMDEFAIEASMREDVYKLVEAAFQKGAELDPESQRLLEKERKSYIRNGLGLPAGPKRDRFKEIKLRLSQISTDFQKNLNEEDGGIWVTREEMKGVPEDVLGGLEKGTGAEEGKLRLSFKYPDLFPTLKFALSAELRQKLFIENENKVCNFAWKVGSMLMYVDSATSTSHSSRRLLSSVTRPRDFWVTPITLPSGSKTRWPRLPRLSSISWVT